MPLLTQQRTCKVLCRLCPVGCSQGLKDVVKELLIEFVRANNGTKPARIIFFRDGVSEGEFLKVKNSSCLSIYSKSHLLSRTVAWIGQDMREYKAVARLGSCRLHRGLCWLTNFGSEQVQEAEIPQVFAAVAELQRSEAAGIPHHIHRVPKAPHDAPVPRRARRGRPQWQRAARCAPLQILIDHGSPLHPSLRAAGFCTRPSGLGWTSAQCVPACLRQGARACTHIDTL